MLLELKKILFSFNYFCEFGDVVCSQSELVEFDI